MDLSRRARRSPSLGKILVCVVQGRLVRKERWISEIAGAACDGAERVCVFVMPLFASAHQSQRTRFERIGTMIEN